MKQIRHSQSVNTRPVVFVKARNAADSDDLVFETMTPAPTLSPFPRPLAHPEDHADPAVTGTDAGALKLAAKNVQDQGYYLIACRPQSKIAKYPKNVYGSLRNPFRPDDPAALDLWDRVPANPAVHLGKSRLVVVDIDSGLEEKTDQEILDWAKEHNFHETYAVVTGRGVHFYFTSDRTTQDNGFFLDGCSGELRAGQNYVLAAGAVHPKTGKTYRALNSLPAVQCPADLEAFSSQDSRQRARSPEPPEKQLEQNVLRTDDNGVKAAEGLIPPDPQTLIPVQNFVMPGGRWKFLNSRAGTLASIGLPPKIIRYLLDVLCTIFCYEGDTYLTENRDALNKIAYSKTLKRGNADLFANAKPAKTGLVLQAAAPSCMELVTTALNSLPAGKRSADEGWAFLNQESLKLDRSLNNHRLMVSRALRKAGIRTENIKGKWYWVKDCPQKSAHEGFIAQPISFLSD